MLEDRDTFKLRGARDSPHIRKVDEQNMSKRGYFQSLTEGMGVFSKSATSKWRVTIGDGRLRDWQENQERHEIVAWHFEAPIAPPMILKSATFVVISKSGYGHPPA